jgi:ELWxxDGT repeat protein
VWPPHPLRQETPDQHSSYTGRAANPAQRVRSIGGANANGILGSFPDFTAFSGELLFSGLDAIGNNGLWVTNGTVAGTHELTGISGAFAVGLFHGLIADFVALNNEVLFNGLDASNQTGLWMTNGTTAGTHELTGISNAFTGSGGLFGGPPTTHVASPPDLTVFKNEALFNGLDAAGDNDLWVTNGTVADTHALSGVNGANAAGLDPFYLTVLKDEVLFNGLDASGNRGLWVTNGTAAGTHELTGIKGANSAGVNPYDPTIFKTEMLFNGIDVAGDNGLWVTNGTVAGTHELTGIKGANLGGLNPSDLTVLNGEMLFRGLDDRFLESGSA